MEHYTTEYYEGNRQGGLSSARIVAPLVSSLVRPKSVVDLGCGTGEWLSVFAEAGAEEILGVERPGFERSMLSVPSEAVVEHDLRQPFRVDRRFDLAVSLEVAEHLPPERAESLIEDLARLAPVVLFSAAVPNQSDAEKNVHINERWQSFWAELFAERGYQVVDCVRPATWQDERVEFWYAQNSFLYVASERLASDEKLKRAKQENQPFPLVAVHPNMRPIATSVVQHKRRRLVKQRDGYRRRMERLEEELEAERSKGLLRCIFGRKGALP